jgi:hypothetical protein
MRDFLKVNYFKSVSLLTIVTFVTYMLTALILVGHARAASITVASDLLTRLQVSTLSSHKLTFTMDAGTSFAAGETMTFDFHGTGTGFTLSSSIATTDVTFNDGTSRTVFAVANNGAPDCTGAGSNDVVLGTNTTTGVITIELCTGATASASGAVVVFKLGVAAGGTNRVTNNATAGSYEIHIAGTFGDTGEVEIPVVDDDTVNVTGYIDTFLTFDIDTAATDVQCDAAGGSSPCDSYGGATDNTGYVVDLGEMTTSAVNNSGDSVGHADGGTGAINYVWFDTSTNAAGGVAVTLVSYFGLNNVDGTPSSLISALEGPGSTNEIRSVPSAAETTITAGSGLYGFAFTNGGTNTVATGTAATIATNYDMDTVGEYGWVPSQATSGTGSPATIYSSTAALDTSRTQFEVAAAPDAQDGTGTYTDQLTFIATGTF